MSTSHGQEYVRTALAILLGGAAFPTVRGIIGGNLELDGYNSDLKLAFEFQGEHHYEPGAFAHHGSILERVQRNDRLKAQRCEESGIKLIIIPIYQFQNERRKICQILVDQMDHHGIDPLELRWTGKIRDIGIEATVRPQWQKEIAIQSRYALFRHGIRSIITKHPVGIPLPNLAEALLKKRISTRWIQTSDVIREIEFAWNGSAESSWTNGRKLGFGWSALVAQGVFFSLNDPIHQSAAKSFAYRKPRFVQG